MPTTPVARQHLQETWGNTTPTQVSAPQFAEPSRSPDPVKFVVKHGSDTQAYTILDHMQDKLRPRRFPVLSGTTEPQLRLAEAIGDKGKQVESAIQAAGQIIFHAVGDTGNTRGPTDESLVSDKMVSDYDDTDPKVVPSFLYHLGDVVYSFGEAEYYYDQFYDNFRAYPAPIFAIPGNHDGMVAPNSTTPSLKAFIENFCTYGEQSHRTPEVGELVRTAQIQPSVYFTLSAPFVRILGLYSNCLEDPGIISDEGGQYPEIGAAQLDFLKAALKRISDERFSGAIIIAVHHPPYVVQRDVSQSSGKHGGSPRMLQDIDAICKTAAVWPHAILSGHAHNYQRFTRHKDKRQTPFIVCGNGGHAVGSLNRRGAPTLRVPVDQPTLSEADKMDGVTFESYDDQDFGYLRIIVNDQQLRIEYHPASDGADAKTPDDAVTVDLASRQLVHFVTPNAESRRLAAGRPRAPRNGRVQRRRRARS